MSLHLLLLFVSAHTYVVLVMLPHEVLSVRLYLHTLVVCISTGSSQSRICSFLALGCWPISPGTISQSKHTLRHWWGLTISYCIKHWTEPDYWVGPFYFWSLLLCFLKVISNINGNYMYGDLSSKYCCNIPSLGCWAFFFFETLAPCKSLAKRMQHVGTTLLHAMCSVRLTIMLCACFTKLQSNIL